LYHWQGQYIWNIYAAYDICITVLRLFNEIIKNRRVDISLAAGLGRDSIGCGRIFEGTPDDLQVALDKLAALPAQTRVYCGHEYTQANCRFALLVEPDNPDLQRKAAQVDVLRAAGQCTLPAVLGEELQANPFLRSRVPAVVSAARRLDPDATPGAAVLGVIRAWKDRS
jgi:hydroxyacylglutathione hydrolase